MKRVTTDYTDYTDFRRYEIAEGKMKTSPQINTDERRFEKDGKLVTVPISES